MARHTLFRPADWTLRTALFYILFQGAHLALFGYGWYKQQTDDRLAALNRLKHSVWISRGAALSASLDVSLLVLPHCRECLRLLRPYMRWFPFEDSQWFHRQVAYSLLFYTSIHTGSHYVNFFNVQALKIRPVIALQIHYTQVGGITGHIMLLCMLLMFTTAHKKIREQSYESFWYIHHLFIVFFIALLCHGAGCFVRDTVKQYSPFAGDDFWEHCIGYQSFRWELIPLTTYLIERIYRIYRSRKDANVVAVFRRAPKLLEVRFEKEGMHYKAGQFLFIKFPDIKADQWHPFSISSCPEDDYVSVHIQQIGDFTDRFADAFDMKENYFQLAQLGTTEISELRLKEGKDFPHIRVDGPYGSLPQDIFRHEVSVMVGAGIGVTPWVSILKSLWHLRNDAAACAKSRLKRIEFIWICKNALSYTWLHDVLEKLEAQTKAMEASSEYRGPILRCRIFVTRHNNSQSLQQAHFHRNRQSVYGLNLAGIDAVQPVNSISDMSIPLKEKEISQPTVTEISIPSPLLTPTESSPSVTPPLPLSPIMPIAQFNRKTRLLPQPIIIPTIGTKYTESALPDGEVRSRPVSSLSDCLWSPTSPTGPALPITLESHFPAEVLHGRPNFTRELAAFAQELTDEGYVKGEGRRRRKVKAGVYYCGPDAPGKSLSSACAQASSDAVIFKYRKERGSYG